MRGTVFLGNRQVELRDFPDPVPGPGVVGRGLRRGARVRVHHDAGCGTCPPFATCRW
jgi:hypothetical protein